MGWWVNDPNMKRSTSFKTKKSAKNVAKQVKGASVSKTPKGQHQSNGWPCLMFALAFVGAVLAMLGAVLAG